MAESFGKAPRSVSACCHGVCTQHRLRTVARHAQGIQDIAYFMNPSSRSSGLRHRRRADLRQLLRDVGEEQFDVDGGLRRHSVQVQRRSCDEAALGKYAWFKPKLFRCFVFVF